MNNKLPDFILADLYKNSLVIEGGSPAKTKNRIPNKEKNISLPDADEPAAAKIFLGNNRKNIAILVRDNEALYIKDEWLQTLGKLLEALSMNLADVAIINLVHHSINFSWLQNNLQPKHIFLFDAETQQIELPFAIPHYQVQKYAGCIIMSAAAITLSPGKTDKAITEEKKKLWQKLKEIFNKL